MASQKHKDMSLFHEDVQCKYCKKAYREPKLLSCLHIVCKRCLKSIIRKRGALICPVCLGKAKLPADGVDGLLPGFTAQRKLYQIEQKNKPRKIDRCTGCEISRNNATSRCVNCDELLCDDCVRAHRRVKFTKDHTINSLADEPEEQQRQQDTILCSNHDKENIENFCKTCDAAVCRICQQQSHSESEYHNLTPLAETLQEFKTSLKTILVKTRENIAPLQKSVYETIKTFGSLQEKVDNVTWEIRMSSRRLIKAVKDREHELLKELRELSDNEADKIVKEKDRVEATLMQVMDGCDFTEDVLDQGYSSDILAVKHLIELRLNSLREQRTDVYLEDCIIDYEGMEKVVVEAIQQGFGYLRFSNVLPASPAKVKQTDSDGSCLANAHAKNIASADLKSQEENTENTDKETVPKTEESSELDQTTSNSISNNKLSKIVKNEGVGNDSTSMIPSEMSRTEDQINDAGPSNTLTSNAGTESRVHLKGARSLPAIPVTEETGTETQKSRKRRLTLTGFLGRKPTKHVGKNNLVSFALATVDNQGRCQELTVDVESPDGSIISAQVLDNKNGTYTVFYCPQTPGDYNMYVSLSGKGIKRGRRVMNFYGCFRKMKSDEIALAGKALSLINWQATPGLLQIKNEKVVPNPKIHFEDVGFI